MKKRFYLDTAIWRDYFEDRSDGIRPLGEFAFQFLKNCENNDCKVLYSNLVVHELRKDFSDKKIQQLLLPFKNFLKKVEIFPEQVVEARKILAQKAKTHETDVLHAIIARDNLAIIITRDSHFECLREIVEVCKPEEVIID